MKEDKNPSPKAASDPLDRAVEASRLHTAGYATEATFRQHWLGFTRESRNFRAQQSRAFGQLLGSVTPSLSNWHILDLGCGDGRWCRAFLEYDARPENVIGLDASDGRLPMGLAKNPLVELIKGDGKSIPFPDGRFDLVTQFVVFSNIPTIELRRRVAGRPDPIEWPEQRELQPLLIWDLDCTRAIISNGQCVLSK